MLWSGVIQALAIPFVLLSRAEHDPADTAREVTPGPQPSEEPRTDATLPPIVE
jgi:hypothetical protein